MRRLRLRSPPLLAMLVVTLALATMGVAYTLWADTLEINGSVATGELDAEWSFAICDEFHPWTPPRSQLMGNSKGRKWGARRWCLTPWTRRSSP